MIGAVGCPIRSCIRLEKVFQHMGLVRFDWPLLAKYQIKEVFIATQQLNVSSPCLIE